MKALFLATALFLAACAHPEDRRWRSVDFGQTASAGEEPRASVYAFSPPSNADSKTRIRDLAGEGQAALIGAMADKGVDRAALLKALATPIGGDGQPGSVDRSRLERVLVINVAKGVASRPGDRLMRTMVTIKPHKPDGEATFEFAGYRVVATDTKVQNIAHLEDQTDASLTATLAPEIGGFGDNKVEGKVGHTSKSTADIVQQYENLSVDITPEQMVVTRESERGLDVVGNTLVAVTLAAPADGDLVHSAYLATATTLYEKGKALAPDAAKLEAAPFKYFARCPLEVDVTLAYRLRRVTSGSEYYTEGKQHVAVISSSKDQGTQTLVRASDAQGSLYQIIDQAKHAVLAQLPGTESRRLLFDSFDDANRMASWLTAERRAGAGKAGLTFNINGAPLPARATYQAIFYSVDCPG